MATTKKKQPYHQKDDDSRVKHGFNAKTFPLAQGISVVSHDNTRLCWFHVSAGVPDSFRCSFCLILEPLDAFPFICSDNILEPSIFLTE